VIVLLLDEFLLEVGRILAIVGSWCLLFIASIVVKLIVFLELIVLALLLP
jgi:hypothetical protein